MSRENPSLSTKTIAVEEHCWIPALRDALVRDASDEIVEYCAGPLDGPLCDLFNERLAVMEDAGVDMQVLSTTSPGTQPLKPADAVALARECNDTIAAAVKQRPDRFAGFATLPTPDPAAAANELRRAVNDLGLVGAMVFPRTGELPLDDGSFRPIFEAAAELAVPIFLHPQMPPRQVRDAYFGGFDTRAELVLTTSGWGWHQDAGLAALRLILAGTFDRHPDLQLILGHWGEMLVSFMERADMLSGSAPGLHRRVAEYISGNVYVTAGGILSHNMLLSAIASLGADRILFASDYPFHSSPGGGAPRFLDSAPISPDERTKIGSRNAERLLRLAV